MSRTAVTPFTKSHPECRSDEIYLGNYTHLASQQIGWRTKRAGCQAYRIDGTPYPNQVSEGIQPYFVKESEWAQHGLGVSVK